MEITATDGCAGDTDEGIERIFDLGNINFVHTDGEWLLFPLDGLHLGVSKVCHEW